MKLRIVKGLRSGTNNECFRVELFVNGAWESTPFVWSSMEQAMYELVQRAAEDRDGRHDGADEVTHDELQAIKARAEAATPAPWRSDGEVVGWMNGAQPGVAVRNENGHIRDAVAMVADMRAAQISGSLRPIEDANFIAHARTDVPALIAEVERLQRHSEALKRLRLVAPSSASPADVAEVMERIVDYILETKAEMT